MKPSRISVWERVKRIIAHAFEMETRLEIQERIERAKFEEEQTRLRLEQRQHIHSLMDEYKHEIEAYQLEKRLKEEEARKEVVRKEQIELHKSNKHWDKYLGGNKPSEESTEE